MQYATTPEHEEQVVEIRFRLPAGSVPVAGAASAEGCRICLDGVVPRGTDRYAKVCRVTGGDPDAVARRSSTDDGSDPRVINRHDHGGLLEVPETSASPSVSLAALGALPRRLDAERGDPVLAAAVPPRYDADEISQRFVETHPGAELVGSRRRSRVAPVTGHREVEAALHERLTARQWEALTAARVGGYYEWPREATAEQLTDDMDVTPPTFSEHLRGAEQELVELLF